MKFDDLLVTQLVNPKKVSFKVVKKAFGKENDLDTKHGRLVTEVLEATNKNLGTWVEAKLPKEVLLKTIIAWHRHGELEISPPKGSTVQEAFKKILKYGKNYDKKCPDCISLINSFRKKIPGHIYLAAEKPNDLYGYPRFKYKKGSLVFLEGLHRLLASAFNIQEEKYKPIKCFVAFRN